jgi:hypothetical protein
MDGDTCGICYKNKVNAVFLDCNHCEVCSKCAYRSTKINGLCPFCRNVRSPNSPHILTKIKENHTIAGLRKIRFGRKGDQGRVPRQMDESWGGGLGSCPS